MQKMPFKQKPRPGQERVIFDATMAGRRGLNIKLPTGYGKTYTAACVYSMLKQNGRVNRLLYVVSNDAQLNQFYTDGRIEFALACVDGPLLITDVSFAGADALRKHRSGACQIFVITIQSLRETRGANNVATLLETGQWMICIDEYHHYGIDKSWGRAALALNRAFLLCMSATPSRPGDDSAFGVPDLVVSYREAVTENAIKSLKGHSYDYRINLQMNGDTVDVTTKDLFEMAGGDSPDKIEKFTIKRKMRWSPKYIYPLIDYPIERMQAQRVRTGRRLQILIVAMCVSHAKMVCEQIQDYYPELKTDWVGTGDYGRLQDENRDVLKRFCPPKDENGQRPPAEIDVLVNVGMAGEGLDCVNVSEIVFLNNASLNNRNIQICGRAARYLDGVVGNINFDSSSEFSQNGYVGEKIMDAMDFQQPAPGDDDDDDDDPEGDEFDYEPLPDEPFIRVYDVELIGIDSGDESVQRMARLIKEKDPTAYDFRGMDNDLKHPDWTPFISLFRTMRAVEAAAFNEKSAIEQLRDDVKNATSAVVGLSLQKASVRRHPEVKQFRGRAWHEINRRKGRLFGSIEGVNDETRLRSHYGWIKQLEREILANGVPAWLRQLFA